MKILIVDDYSDNRMTIQLLLEEFDDIDASEAEDGQEAIDMCRKENFDIVFMDIMMPNVDGIKATKIIKSFNKQVMILALSALDDEESKNNMLASGAEDYMTKPIEDELFHQRVKNYIQIVNLRKRSPLNADAVNFFTKEVYSRSLKFNITSLQALSELWDYYLNDASKDIDAIEDCMRMIYAYCQYSLKLGYSLAVISEENKENIYLTLAPLNALTEPIIKNTLVKHYSSAIFIIKDKELCFRLPKAKSINNAENLIKQVPTETLIEEALNEELDVKVEGNNKKELTQYQQSILSKTHFNKVTALEYVEGTAISLIDKVEELENILVELETSSISFETDPTKETMTQITSNLHSFIEVVDELFEFEHFAFALHTLNEFLIDLNVEGTDKKDCKKFSTIFIHFIDDIAEWRKNIFILQEANDVHYLDSSLLSSCLQIQAIFDKQEVTQEDEDDFELF